MISEYKRFIWFRAQTMVRIYGPNGSKYFQRPKYSEINKGKIYYKAKNKESIENLRIRYKEKNENDAKLLNVLQIQPDEVATKRRLSRNDTPISLRRRNTRDRETPASRLSQSFSNIAHVKDNEDPKIKIDPINTTRAKTEEPLVTTAQVATTGKLYKMPTIAVNAKPIII